MLVYCKDEKAPKQNACSTMIQTGVLGPAVAKSIRIKPRMTVLEISTRR